MWWRWKLSKTTAIPSGPTQRVAPVRNHAFWGVFNTRGSGCSHQRDSKSTYATQKNIVQTLIIPSQQGLSLNLCVSLCLHNGSTYLQLPSSQLVAAFFLSHLSQSQYGLEGIWRCSSRMNGTMIVMINDWWLVLLMLTITVFVGTICYLLLLSPLWSPPIINASFVLIICQYHLE